MFSFANIYKAYIACRKHKRNTINQLEFEADLLENLWYLQSDLTSRKYKIGKSLCFLTSSPKLREVFAADFRERVVHHVLVQALEPFYEKKFIHDVYNNRKSRGTHSAVKQSQKYMHRTTGGGYYLQLDVKRVLKVKSYIRYVDDFVLFHTSKQKLQELKFEISEYLKNELDLELRADTKLKKHSDGLDFLGYIIRENYILTRKRVVNNYKYKKAKYLDNYEHQKGKMSLEEIKNFLSVQASFVGHIKHANSYNLMQKVGVIDEKNPFDYDRS